MILVVMEKYKRLRLGKKPKNTHQLQSSQKIYSRHHWATYFIGWILSQRPTFFMGSESIIFQQKYH